MFVVAYIPLPFLAVPAARRRSSSQKCGWRSLPLFVYLFINFFFLILHCYPDRLAVHETKHARRLKREPVSRTSLLFHRGYRVCFVFF